MVHRVGKRHDIDQLFRIEPAGRRGGNVPDIVRTRAEGCEAEIRRLHENRGAILRHDFADLKIPPGGEVDEAAAPVSGDFCHPAKLAGVQRTACDPRAEHDAFLRRAYEEEAVKLVSEGIATLGEFGLRGICKDLVVAIQTVPFVFDQLFPAQVIERCAMDCFPDSFLLVMGKPSSCILAEERHFPGLENTGDETTEILRLLFGKGCIVD